MTYRLLLALCLGLLVSAGCTPRGSSGRTDDDDDDDSAVDDDDATGDDDDATGDDDDATGDDDDATGDDDDATGDDDDATGDDDDSTSGDDDDATGDDDDSTAGDDDDSTTSAFQPGDVIVSEVMINPGAVDDTQGEWIELLNLTGFNIDLSGWTLSDRDSDNLVISPAAALFLPSGDYVILGRSDVPGDNGGAPVDWAYGTAFTMANSADEVVLTEPGGTEIYALEYTSGFPNPSGSSTQLSGDLLTYAASLDLVNNWCTANQASAGTYGMGDAGTPGQQNATCPP